MRIDLDFTVYIFIACLAVRIYPINSLCFLENVISFHFEIKQKTCQDVVKEAKV